MRTGKALAAALAAALTLAACGGGPPKPTVDTCATAIEAHPDSAAYPVMCKGLTGDQLMKATAIAMANGARG
jgi:hypothetical protein